MNSHLLLRTCPCCDGGGMVRLTPKDAGPYGMKLLRGLADGAAHEAGDLPLSDSGLLQTRAMALKRLESMGLVVREKQYGAHGGARLYHYQITRVGTALLQAVSHE